MVNPRHRGRVKVSGQSGKWKVADHGDASALLSMARSFPYFLPMKSFVLLGAILAVASPFSAHAQVSPVSVRVEQLLKSDTNKFAHIQKRSLKIAVRNASDTDK